MNCLRGIYTCIISTPSCIGGTCKSCWTTNEDRYDPANVQTPQQREALNTYAQASRISGVAFLAIEIAGLVLLGFAFKSPPPFHMLTGLYVCLGGLILLPVALMIISHQREAYCKTHGLDSSKIYKPPPKRRESDSD